MGGLLEKYLYRAARVNRRLSTTWCVQEAPSAIPMLGAKSPDFAIFIVGSVPPVFACDVVFRCVHCTCCDQVSQNGINPTAVLRDLQSGAGTCCLHLIIFSAPNLNLLSSL